MPDKPIIMNILLISLQAFSKELIRLLQVVIQDQEKITITASSPTSWISSYIDLVVTKGKKLHSSLNFLMIPYLLGTVQNIVESLSTIPATLELSGVIVDLPVSQIQAFAVSKNANDIDLSLVLSSSWILL